MQIGTRQFVLGTMLLVTVTARYVACDTARAEQYRRSDIEAAIKGLSNEDHWGSTSSTTVPLHCR